MARGGCAGRCTSPSSAAVRFLLSAAGALVLIAGPLVSGASAQSPTNDAVPVISGNAWVGQTLSLQRGTWEDSPQVSDRWQDCNTAGDVCAPIQNATGATYTVATSDLGHTIQVAETATAPDTSTATALSNRTPTITPPSNQAPPTVSGTLAPGQTLTASTGSWTDDPTAYAYQWEDCASSGAGCAPIAGATQPTYTVAPSDAGSTLVVQETAFDESTPGAPADSGPTGVVPSASAVALAVSHAGVIVNQTVVLAATVTAAETGASPAGSITFTAGGKAISVCTGVAVNGAGQSETVSCKASFPAGHAQLAAVFNPSPGSVVLGSASPTVTLPVRRDPTRITLRVAKQVMAGTRLAYSATLSIPSEGGHTFRPSGSIEFSDHGKPIPACARQRMIKFAATCPVTYVLPGKHTITAGYRGDINFAPATSAGSGLSVTPIPVTGEIDSTLQWTFYFTPSYTEVVALMLSGIPSGASVQLGCDGLGCPFTRRDEALPGAATCVSAGRAGCASYTLSLTSSLAGRRLGVGAQITLLIAHADYVGKYYSFTVRPRAQPLIRISCLAPDSPIPGAACAFGQTASGAG
jgi:hypothetical protein